MDNPAPKRISPSVAMSLVSAVELRRVKVQRRVSGGW